MQISGPTPDLLSQKFQGRGQAIYVLTNPPEALDAHQSLRIPGIAERKQFLSLILLLTKFIFLILFP